MSQLAVESTPPAVAPGVLGNPPATEVGAAAAFAVAIRLAMGVGTPGPVAAGPGTGADVTGPTAANGTPGGQSDPTAEPDASEVDPGDATTGEAAAAAAGLPVPLSVPLPVPAPVPASVPLTVAAAANASASTGQDGDPTVRGTTPAAAAPTAAPARTRKEQTAPTSPTDAPTTGATAPRPVHGARPDVPADRREQGPATGTAPASASQSVAAAAPTTTPTTTMPTAAPTSSHPAARAVATQVVPEVTKLFSNGEGVHRVTLELNPKALGEVRVVLTVRNGDVHVRLAAGTEARQALAHSSADLARALEHIGVKDHRLTLAELPGVAASAGSQTFSDTADPRDPNAAFTGRFDTEQHHDSRQPRMGDGSTATDGTDQEHGTRSRGDRSVHEVNHVPSRGGVDLRM